MLELNIKGYAEEYVHDGNTAKAVGSGSLAVYATPAMTALMEKAACACLEGKLEDGQTSVGTLLNIRHLSATPTGLKVWCEAELTAIEAPKLTFAVTAFDEVGKIGEGVHERFIVKSERFTEKAYSKVTK